MLVTLPHQTVVRATCGLDGADTGRAPGDRSERRRIAAVPQVGPRLHKSTLAEERRGRRPGLGLAATIVGLGLRAQRDQLGEIVHRLDASCRSNPDEAVRVEVVAKEKCGVGVGRPKEPGAPVVKEVSFVDRLDTKRVRRVAEAREDRGSVLRITRKE